MNIEYCLRIAYDIISTKQLVTLFHEHSHAHSSHKMFQSSIGAMSICSLQTHLKHIESFATKQHQHLETITYNVHLKTLHKKEQQQKTCQYLAQFCHSHNSPYINAKKSHVLHHCRLIANHNTRVISLSLNSIISAAKNAKRDQVFTPTMKEFRSERTSSSWSSSRPRNSSQKVIVVIWATEKKTFHCGCLIGILIMVEHIIPHNWVMYNIPLTNRLFIAHMNGHQDVVVLRGFFQVQKYNTLQPLGRLDVQLSDRQHRRCRVAFLSSITKSYQVSEEHTSKQKTQPKHVILANSGISKYC